MTKPKAVPAAPKRVRKPKASAAGIRVEKVTIRPTPKEKRVFTMEMLANAAADIVTSRINPIISQISAALEILVECSPAQPKPEAKQPDPGINPKVLSERVRNDLLGTKQPEPVLYDERAMGDVETIDRDTDWIEWEDGTTVPADSSHGIKVGRLRSQGHHFTPGIKRVLRRTPRAAAEPVAEAPAPEVGVLERLGRKPFVQWSAADWQEAALISGSIAEAYPATLAIEQEQDRREQESAARTSPQTQEPVNTCCAPPPNTPYPMSKASIKKTEEVAFYAEAGAQPDTGVGSGAPEWFTGTAMEWRDVEANRAHIKSMEQGAMHPPRPCNAFKTPLSAEWPDVIGAGKGLGPETAPKDDLQCIRVALAALAELMESNLRARSS